MHWPASLDPSKEHAAYEDWDFVDTWGEMQKLVDTGKVKTIGVSNFAIKNLEKLLSHKNTKVCFRTPDPPASRSLPLLLTYAPIDC